MEGGRIKTHRQTECKLCGAEVENINHFVPWCPPLQDTRRRAIELQPPYQEAEEKILGRFLFEDVRLEEKIKYYTR